MSTWETPAEIEALLYEWDPSDRPAASVDLRGLTSEELYWELKNPQGVSAERRHEIEAEFIRRRYERRKNDELLEIPAPANNSSEPVTHRRPA